MSAVNMLLSVKCFKLAAVEVSIYCSSIAADTRPGYAFRFTDVELLQSNNLVFLIYE